MNAHGMERIVLLKLDCKGAEYSILHRCPSDVLGCFGAIVMETHADDGPDNDRDGVARFLEGHGFRTRTGGRDLVTTWRTDR